jgi:hypothetical protein
VDKTGLFRYYGRLLGLILDYDKSDNRTEDKKMYHIAFKQGLGIASLKDLSDLELCRYVQEVEAFLVTDLKIEIDKRELKEIFDGNN